MQYSSNSQQKQSIWIWRDPCTAPPEMCTWVCRSSVQTFSVLLWHSLIYDRQYDFLRQQSTADLLTHITLIWNSAVHSCGESSIVALDITKVFDRDWHAALLNTHHLIDFHLPFWAKDTSIGWRALADLYKIIASVPQGTLTPMLFLIRIDDLLFATKIPCSALWTTTQFTPVFYLTNE